MHIKELIGKKYGFLTITGLAKHRERVLHVICECECGISASYILENIERGKIKSCGCMNDSNSPLFLKMFKEKLWSLIDKHEDCWIWKGGHRQSKYFSPWINFKNKQYNPVRFFAEEQGEDVHGNWAFVRQCNTPLCVNPSHHVKVSRDNIKKAITKEIKGEYLRNR